MALVDRLIHWLAHRDRTVMNDVVTFDGVLLFHRYAPFWQDEWQGRNRPPWYRRFNLFLHHWQHGESGAFHDHPRWSITICLKGRIIEQTPWGDKSLRPGSIVFRSRKAIHAFELPEDAGETWTLFIVGRRNHLQNTYTIKRRTAKECGMARAAPATFARPSRSHDPDAAPKRSASGSNGVPAQGTSVHRGLVA